MKIMEKYQKRLYIVLSCVVYNLTENYVCIDCLSCQSKILSNISSNPTFKDKGFNLLLGIWTPNFLLNLVSCNGFTKKPNSTVILNCQSRLINNYLSKGLPIIEQNKNQLSLITNDVKLIVNLIDQLEIYYVMVKNEAIYAVANTMKQLHIHKNMHMTYKQYFYNT